MYVKIIDLNETKCASIKIIELNEINVHTLKLLSSMK